MQNTIRDLRLEALKRFAIAITALNIAGHIFLGFEQSWAHPIVAMLTTYSLELFFEWLNCNLYGLRPRYIGGPKKLVQFFLSAHITAMAVSMLLFTNENLAPIMFGCAVAICSKVLFRIKINGNTRHFLNPSNTGIAVTLILFPWIGIAPPYQFTENTSGMTDWLLPLIFISLGSYLNTKFTRKMPLIIAWFTAFCLQAILRSWILNASLLAALNPMTGVAFLLFSFYMISDPATTPTKRTEQVGFGFCIAFVYGLLVSFNLVFGQFFALLIVCLGRGGILWVKSITARFLRKKEEIPLVILQNGRNVMRSITDKA